MTLFNRLGYVGVGLLLATSQLMAQSSKIEADAAQHRNITLSLGLSRVAAKDYSASPLLYTGTAPRVEVGYEWGRAATVSSALAINYRGGTITNTTPGPSGFTVHNGSIHYHRLKAVGAQKRLWVGGSSTIFARVRVHDFYDNNFLSYDIGWNVGVAAAYQQPITDRLAARLHVNLPLVAYYVRPVYGFNFPENFLTEEHYNARLDGVYGALLTSGEIVSFNKYFELNTGISIAYQLNYVLSEIRLNYQWNYAQFESLESSYFGEQALSLSFVRNL